MRKLLPLAAAAVVSLTLAGCSGSHPEPRPSAPSPAQIEVSAYLRSDISADQRQALDQKLHRLPGLRDVSFETKEHAYQKFKKEFQDIDPDMVAKTKPDSLPESYSATIVKDARELGMVWLGERTYSVTGLPNH